jgi:hypothetical protein
VAGRPAVSCRVACGAGIRALLVTEGAQGAGEIGLSDLDDRHHELLRILVGSGLRFVLVGGVALQLRGFSGATRDVDVTIAADDVNARCRDQALEALRAQPYLTGERGVAYRTRPGPA